MVVLPKKLKYKQEIFGAIIDIFSHNKDDEIHYNEIWRKVKKVLGNKKLSLRDFQNHINYMKTEKILKRRKSEGLGLPKVYFSLTDRAKRMNTFKILGIDESVKNRKKIYQLLLFFKLVKRRNPITQRQLYKFLEQIGKSRKALEIAKQTGKIIHYNPIKGVEIIRWRQNDSSTSVYHVTIPGFTVKEFTSYLKKLKKGKEPRSFPYYTGITTVNLVADVKVSESEIIDAIISLRNNGLIERIKDVFHVEERYDIVDESLIEFLKDIWMVHDIDLRLLFERIVYCDELKDEDKDTLKLMYGKKVAERLLAIEYNRRKMIKDQKFRDEEITARKYVISQSEYRASFVQDILKRHEKVIKNYEIMNELIDGICFPSFMSNKK